MNLVLQDVEEQYTVLLRVQRARPPAPGATRAATHTAASRVVCGLHWPALILCAPRACPQAAAGGSACATAGSRSTGGGSCGRCLCEGTAWCSWQQQGQEVEGEQQQQEQRRQRRQRREEKDQQLLRRGEAEMLTGESGSIQFSLAGCAPLRLTVHAVFTTRDARGRRQAATEMGLTRNKPTAGEDPACMPMQQGKNGAV